MITERLAAVYHLAKEISIDEAMIPFKDRSSLKLYANEANQKRNQNMDEGQCREWICVCIGCIYR